MVKTILHGGPLDGLTFGLDSLERPALEFPIPLGSVWDFSTTDYDAGMTTYERSLTLEQDEQGRYIYTFMEPQ